MRKVSLSGVNGINGAGSKARTTNKLDCLSTQIPRIYSFLLRMRHKVHRILGEGEKRKPLCAAAVAPGTPEVGFGKVRIFTRKRHQNVRSNDRCKIGFARG